MQKSNWNIALELLKAADYYQEEGLARKCEQLLKLYVAVENVCLVYSVAAEHNAQVRKKNSVFSAFQKTQLIPTPFLLSFLQELKRYDLDFARPLLEHVFDSEGFAALDKRLTDQFVRELHAKRRLVETNSSSSDDDQDESQAVKRLR